MDKTVKITSKTRIIILAIMLIIGILTLSGCTQDKSQNTANETNNVVNNTTNTTSKPSLRDQMFGTQANLIESVANQNQTITEIKLEDLEKYNKENDENYKTYTAPNGLSFMYPNKWISVSKEGEIAFMAPDIKGASVNVATDKLEAMSGIVTNFDGYIAFQKLYLTQNMIMLTDINEKAVNLNGRKAYILNYETESGEAENSIQLNVTQVAFEDNGEINILTLAVIRDYYNELKPTFEKMIKSFTK